MIDDFFVCVFVWFFLWNVVCDGEFELGCYFVIVWMYVFVEFNIGLFMGVFVNVVYMFCYFVGDVCCDEE